MRAWLLFLAGCGRLAFDAGSDGRATRICEAPVGHDEDSDGIDDACDGCPHRSDSGQPDMDGDGVDDMCDPRPAVPGDAIVFFDPFVTRDPSWTSNGIDGTYVDDGVYADARAGARYLLRRPHASSDDTFILGGAVRGAVSKRQLILGTLSTGAAHYYCELEGDTTDAKLAATYTLDGALYEVLVRSMGPPFENGDFELSFRDANPTIECATTWGVPEPFLTDTLPTSISSDRLNIEVSSMEVLLQYFVHIRSN